MANFTIGEVRYAADKLIEVSIQCTDPAEPPAFFFECETAPISEVVHLIQSGANVFAGWRTDSGLAKIPVAVITLPDGELSIETAESGRPAGRMLSDLPRSEGSADI